MHILDPNWREKGVINWARAAGLDIAQHDNRYTMWSKHSLKIVLDNVELDEVERYLSYYEVAC